MAQSTPLFVGLDVHKDSIAVAHVRGQSAEAPVFVGEIGTRQSDLEKLIRRLQTKTARLVFGRPTERPRRNLESASEGGPGFRVTLDDVTRRLRPILVARVRQARDGSQ